MCKYYHIKPFMQLHKIWKFRYKFSYICLTNNYLSYPNIGCHMINIWHQHWCIMGFVWKTISISTYTVHNWLLRLLMNLVSNMIPCSTSSATAAIVRCPHVDVVGFRHWGTSSSSPTTYLPKVLPKNLPKVWRNSLVLTIIYKFTH